MGELDGNPEQCTLFHETTSPDSNRNTVAANKCYGLLNGQAQVSFLLSTGGMMMMGRWLMGFCVVREIVVETIGM